MLRFLFRLGVLALAAFGAKALYDKLAPKQDQLRSTADTFIDRTSTAAKEMGTKVSGAAQHLASTAQSDASDVRDTAARQADEVKSAAQQAKDDVRRELDDSVHTQGARS